MIILRIPDEEIQQAINMFNEGLSITKIAKQLGRDRGTLSIRMKAAGVNIVQHCNKKSVNSNFFNDWNEKSAYWLGFIFADGHLAENGGLEICIKDKEHIEKFKAQRELYFTTNAFCFDATKICFAKWLLIKRDFVCNERLLQELADLPWHQGRLPAAAGS